MYLWNSRETHRRPGTRLLWRGASLADYSVLRFPTTRRKLRREDELMSAPSDPPAAPAGRVETQSAVLHWLEALAAGGCDQRAFLARIDPLLRGSEDAAWELLALLDQHYRRGKIQANQFQALKAHVQRVALGAGD